MTRYAPSLTARHGLVAALLASLLIVTGCSGLPVSGPVVEAEGAGEPDDRRAPDVTVEPPQPNSSELEIVRGFLDAMTASPIRIDIARQYLTEQAASAWDPAAATITYADKLSRDEGASVSVQLSEAEEIDGAGSWRGRLPPRRQQLSFLTSSVDGEPRISNPPDALIVPASWFAQRYRQYSLYYFDRAASTLVAEPVFVTTGGQLATSLVTALLRGPGEELDDVVRNFLPRRAKLGLSVSVTEGGVAEVPLVGGTASLSEATTERLFAQLARTLRQDPSINAIRVQIDGQAILTPEGGSTYPIDGGETYDASNLATPRLFALVDGRLHSALETTFEALTGPLSQEDLGLDQVSVDLTGERAAATTVQGEMLLAPTESGSGGGNDPDEEPDPRSTVSVLRVGGNEWLTPRWDGRGRLWMIDRTTTGASVNYLEDGRLREIEVPGVTGRNVRGFLVSRDSTRFVAVVRTRAGDQLRSLRVRVNDRGRVSGFTRPIDLLDAEVADRRIRDIAWISDTALALLSPIQLGDRAEVSTANVDGAPVGVDGLATTVTGAFGLAGTPVTERASYAVTGSELIEIGSGRTITLPERTRSLDFAG